jgi:hypothetical protein
LKRKSGQWVRQESISLQPDLTTERKMKNKITVSMAALLVASLGAAQAQTNITAWTFDNLSIAANSSPAPSTGSGTAMAIGLTTSLTPTPSVSNPDVQSLAGSSSGGANAWRVRAKGTSPNTGNGWTSQAAIGTQGAEFDASTAGFNNIQISFDINETAQGEANLQLEYTINGSAWLNATITSAGTLGTIENNSSSASTVDGSYVKLSGSGTGWNNQITSDLSGITGVNNDASFGIRIVNASTGADCVNSTGGALNNTSGNWSMDNVVISGISAVPEPSTSALAGLGLAGWLGFRRLKNRQSSQKSNLAPHSEAGN